MKYKDWLFEWLNIYIQPSTKMRTYARYKSIALLHIAPNIGEYELSEITSMVLQQFISKLCSTDKKIIGKGLSANYVKNIVTLAQSSLKAAHSAGLLAEYSAGKIKCPKTTEKQVQSFSFAEQKEIERYIFENKQQKLKGVVICFYTGLRIGELLALTWDDIDFDKNILTVSKSCYDGYIGGKHCTITDTPKTQNSTRQIPICKQLKALLKQLEKCTTSKYVLSHNGKQILVRSYQRAFELLLKKLNIPHKGFHATRHTFATRAIECGMDVKTLSEILGHKNATITLNRYAHSLWEHKSDMMNKLGKLM